MIHSMNSTTRTPPFVVTVYGIPNCDTVKKARVWLSDHGAEVTFHDFKKLGVPAARSAHLGASRGLGDPGEPQRHDLAQAR